MALLLATALILQPKPPVADLMKKVEERYAAAKSLSVTMTATVKREGGSSFGQESWKGTFKSKSDGQARIEFDWIPDDGKPVRMTWISDGMSMVCGIDKQAPQKRGSMPQIGSWARRFHARVGVAGFMTSLQQALFKSGSGPKLQGLYPIAKLADAGEERLGNIDCRVVSYTFQPPDRARPAETCRLWIEPLTLVVHQRKAVTKSAGATVTLMETFTNHVFDAEIKDEEFLLPAK